MIKSMTEKMLSLLVTKSITICYFYDLVTKIVTKFLVIKKNITKSMTILI